jgi:hypothetical protein
MGALPAINNSKVLLNLLESSAPHNIRNTMGAPPIISLSVPIASPIRQLVYAYVDQASNKHIQLRQTERPPVLIMMSRSITISRSNHKIEDCRCKKQTENCYWVSGALRGMNRSRMFSNNNRLKVWIFDVSGRIRSREGLRKYWLEDFFW